MTENQTPETPDWTPDNDQRPTAEVFLPDPDPLPASEAATSDQPQRRWVVPAGIVAGALLAGMLGGAVSAAVISHDDHGHRLPDMSQSGGQIQPGPPGAPGLGQPGAPLPDDDEFGQPGSQED